jgi:hypothetical protein
MHRIDHPEFYKSATRRLSFAKCCSQPRLVYFYQTANFIYNALLRFFAQPDHLRLMTLRSHIQYITTI